MKILYFGGQNSGKSALAEKHILSLATNKPYYIATYDNSFDDKDMQNKIDNHINARADKFITIEESFDLTKVIKEENSYIVECISMWIFNNLDKDIDILLSQLDTIKSNSANIVFVLNDVNGGIIPLDKQSRRFVKYSGIIGQKLTSFCDEVYEVKYGLKQKLK